MLWGPAPAQEALDLSSSRWPPSAARRLTKTLHCSMPLCRVFWRAERADRIRLLCAARSSRRRASPTLVGVSTGMQRGCQHLNVQARFGGP